MIDDAWVIGDMDEGILFGAPTKRQCLALIDWLGTPILRRHRYGPGNYEYITGYPDEESTESYFVTNLDVARRDGFDLDEDVRRCSTCGGYCRQQDDTWTCKVCGHEEEEK